MAAIPEEKRAMLDRYYDRVTTACLSAYEEEGAPDITALATRIMALPGFPMHYPVHHYLVPAILLTAARKAQGHGIEVIERDLAEALERAKEVPGGFCGFQGTCGAAVGVGIFFSVITDSSPMAKDTWGLSNKATGTTLLKMAAYGGPRCCKRCTYLALLNGARETEEALGLVLKAGIPVCQFYPQNAEDCLKEDCPFYPHA